MVEHIFEILRLVVFGAKWFKCDTSKSYLRNNPAKEQRRHGSRHFIPMFIETPCRGNSDQSGLSSF